MSLTKPDLIAVAALLGAHGVRGDVRVKSLTDDPATMFHFGPLRSQDGKLVLEPKSYRQAKDHFIVTPKTPLQKEDWDALKGTRLYVERARLPAPDIDEYYVEDLIGLAVLDADSQSIGRVRAVFNHGAGDLLEIQPHGDGPVVLVPFTETDVPQLNLAEGTVTITSFDIWADQTGSPERD